jgi:hypothetical protein
MKLVYRGGLPFFLTRNRSQPDLQPPQASQADYQGLRYSRYGVRYTE